ncbi:MAG: exo-beta-N-acetylmuramidase NamZ domain-containing protein, partial [Acidobacteriota bacterium]
MSVIPGLEILLHERLHLVEGRRLGVIANPASIDSNFSHIVDLFFSHPAVNLTTILGPQHGVRGETQDNMIEWRDYLDPVTRLPVHSLYGEARKPSQRILADLDVLVFDLQDVGSRYYTFISTMALAMQACREENKTFLVLDRPNPINGVDVAGPVLNPDFRSFVGLYPLAVRHGMTVAEMARYFNSEFDIGCRLEVVPMKGWRRSMCFDETGLPWVPPSPNIPTLESAIVYPGSCLLEGTNVSEGRGTTRPFELSGAPWVQPLEMASRLDRVALPGIRWRPAFFVPTFHKWSGQLCAGVQIHVTDRRIFRPFLTGLA